VYIYYCVFHSVTVLYVLTINVYKLEGVWGKNARARASTRRMHARSSRDYKARTVKTIRHSRLERDPNHVGEKQRTENDYREAIYIYD